jgi:hypothetical protein
MNTWYLAKVKHLAQQENGSVKRVTAPILVSGINFTEVEAKLIKEMSETVQGEFKITNISPTRYSDIFDFTEENESMEEEHFFDCKIAYLSITDDKSKKNVIPVLMSASDVKQAETRLISSMKPLIPDFETISIKKTSILSIIK